jgi:hypothetical protein
MFPAKINSNHWQSEIRVRTTRESLMHRTGNWISTGRISKSWVMGGKFQFSMSIASV